MSVSVSQSQSLDDKDQYDYLAKMILLGDAGVGKSNLLMRWTRGEFDLETKATIGVEFASKLVEIAGKKINVQVWDTAGQERFRSVTKAFYHGALGAVVVYDITNRQTFDSVQDWINDCRSFASEGNKADLDHLRDVPLKVAEDFAQKNGLAFMETSALKNTGVNEAYTALVSDIYTVGTGANKKAEHPWNNPIDKNALSHMITLHEDDSSEQESTPCC